MARKPAARRKAPAKKAAASRDTMADAAMPVTQHRHVPVEAAQAQPEEGGATTGYRDGPEGTIETADFPGGVLSKGWNDTPAKCKNYPGHHIDYVKVKAT